MESFSNTSQPALRRALERLLRSWDYADDCEGDVWDFAVTVVELWEFGLTMDDLRYLVHKQYVHHAIEKTKPLKALLRLFGPQNPGVITPKSAFVLTRAGAEAARKLQASSLQCDCPHYDGGVHELWLGIELVKRYQRPAPAQHTILSCFEEERWIRCIPNPLAADDFDEDPKMRLHHAICRLNRHQLQRLIHFGRDGTGNGIRWEPWNKKR